VILTYITTDDSCTAIGTGTIGTQNLPRQRFLQIRHFDLIETQITHFKSSYLRFNLYSQTKVQIIFKNYKKADFFYQQFMHKPAKNFSPASPGGLFSLTTDVPSHAARVAFLIVFFRDGLTALHLSAVDIPCLQPERSAAPTHTLRPVRTPLTRQQQFFPVRTRSE
jgi:hypothetical protein